MEVSSHHNKKNHCHVCTSSMNGCGTPGQEEEADDPSNPKATPCSTIGWLAARLWEWSPGPTPKGSWRPWDGDQASNSQPLLTWGPPSTRVPRPLSAARTWTARKSTARICTWLTRVSTIPTACSDEEGVDLWPQECLSPRPRNKEEFTDFFSPGCGEFGGIVCWGKYPLGG